MSFSEEMKVGVVIPAYLEEKLLPLTLQGIPERVSTIVVVVDGSPDKTLEVAVRCAENDNRIDIIVFGYNQGVGRAISTGYKRAESLGCEIVVVMAGDNQMDARDLGPLIGPIETGKADYVKGDRLGHESISDMPVVRRVGTTLLAKMTKAVAGLESLRDSQCGYTAIRTSIFSRLELDDLFPRYGYPNDILIQISKLGYRIAEVPVRPVYANEVSGFKAHQVVVPILGILWRGRRK